MANQAFAFNPTAIAKLFIRFMERSIPYFSIFNKGVFPNGVADLHEVIVPVRSAVGVSSTKPEFVPRASLCTAAASVTKQGSVKFQYRMEGADIESEPICANENTNIFKGQIKARIEQMKKDITEILSRRARIVAVEQSGFKYVVKADADIGDTLTGNEFGIAASFASVASDAPPTLATLIDLKDTLTTDYQVDQFGEGEDKHLILIGSSTLSNYLKKDPTYRADLRARATGNVASAAKNLNAYGFKDLHEGLKFATDEEPLRATFDTEDGEYDYVARYVEVDVAVGSKAWQTNPAWQAAPYEFAVLAGKDSFERQTPEEYLGEGEAKFPTQGLNNLKWFLDPTRPHQDSGKIVARLMDTYAPLKPWNLCAIVYNRQCLKSRATACAVVS